MPRKLSRNPEVAQRCPPRPALRLAGGQVHRVEAAPLDAHADQAVARRRELRGHVPPGKSRKPWRGCGSFCDLDLLFGDHNLLLGALIRFEISPPWI